MPRWDWEPLPREGCVNVDVRVLHAQGPHHAVMLRFAPGGTIDEHAHDAPIAVMCLEGEGKTSVDGAVHDLRAGQELSWPAGQPHRLWTEGAAMTALLLHFAG